MTRIIYALSGLAAILLTVILSVAVTLMIMRSELASQNQRFVSVNMQELILMLADTSGGSDEEFAMAVRDLGRSIEAAVTDLGNDHVVVFDADVILTGAPDVTPQVWQLLQDYKAAGQ